MKLKVTLMTLLVMAFSYGVYAQACCTGPGVSYPNGSTQTVSYTSVASTTTSSTSVGYVGDPNVISMGTVSYSAPSTTYSGTTYTGDYGSSTFYPAKSCCQGPAVNYPSGRTATVTSYGTTNSGNYGIGAGDPNVIYMGGVTTSIATDTYINTSSVGNSCCGGPGITYPGQGSSGY